MLVRRSVDGHDSGDIEFRISNFRYPVSDAHALSLPYVIIKEIENESHTFML
jgi:hypothetical protein